MAYTELGGDGVTVDRSGVKQGVLAFDKPSGPILSCH